MIFQDPYASLNPRWRVERIIAEPMRSHGIAKGGRTLKSRVAQLLTDVGLSPQDADKYPHEFSGGQRQRISIARALSSNPEFLVCDEPTSALDVSVQAQILNLLEHLKVRFGLTMLFISHDLSVVKNISDRVMVMYLGKMCEVASTDQLFGAPAHPYSRALLASIPGNTLGLPPAEELISGELPSPLDPPSGCRFRTRCPLASDECATDEPVLRELADGHFVACHHPVV
jgi:oligopeptide/dipeptide ABC transporter ATP-binding protein